MTHWLKVSEAAEHCRVSVRTFRKLVAIKRLPAGCAVSTRIHVWKAQDLDAAIRWFAPDEPPEKATMRHRCVYFIGGKRLIKIGTAEHAHFRLNELKCASPEPLQILAYIPGASFKQERQLHEYFAAYRKHGEWFDLPKTWRQEVGLGGILVDANEALA